MEQVKRILWVDDDVKRLELSVDIDEFNDRGFEVIKASNPDECKEIIAQRQDFKCIIVDISMPTGKSVDFGAAKGGMRTGLVVLKELVKNDRLNNIKKVVYTIVDDEEVRNYCEENNIPYLSKRNFLSDTFVTRISKIISGSED